MTTIREIKESPIRQGVEEQITYTLTIPASWGSSPSSITVVAKDITTTTVADVTATVFPTNSPMVLGDVITLSPLRSLTDGHVYRIEIKFTCSGNVFEAWGEVIAEL